VLAREHAPELEPGDLPLELVEVRDDGRDGVLVVLVARHLEEILRVAESAVDRLEDIDGVLQRGALLTELLRALRIVPDGRILELPQDLFETFSLAFVVKGTP